MLEMAWGKENPNLLLVEFQTSAATMQLSMVNSQKAKSKPITLVS